MKIALLVRLSFFLLFLLSPPCPAVSDSLQTMSSSDHFVEYKVLEQLAPDHFVGNVLVDFALDLKYPPDFLGQLRFHFLAKNRNSNSTEFPSSLFQVHKERGVITTGAEIDREVLCPKAPASCYVRLDIAVQPAKFFQILKVQIEIVDVNDNSPVFPCASFAHRISEASEEGASFLLPTATDDDSGRFSVQRYHLVPSHGTPFQLKRRQSWSEAVTSMDEVRLLLKERLDREKQDAYEFLVVASDGGQPSKTGVLSVKIQVLDANDNKPQFDKSTYEVWLEESTPAGTVLLELHADDRDEGANGQVTYNLSFNSQQEFGSLVGIGESSGQLYLREEVDYERGPVTMPLSVVARDKGHDPLQSFVSVLLHVQDVNDNQPDVTVTTLTSSGHAEVSENVEAGTFVAHLSVVDYDVGPCGQVSCHSSNDYFEVVRLYKSEFKLVTSRDLRGLTMGNNEVSVSCSDCGVPRLTTVVGINILLKRRDEEEEEERKTFDVSIEENFLSPSPLLVLRTSGAGTRPSFRLVGSEDCGEFLTLNERTGEVVQLKTFDHERTPTLTCRVEDGSTPSKVVPIRVNVVDRNDERPRFEKDVFVFSVFVERPLGQLVGRLRASDGDSPPYNAFYFSFLESRGAKFLYLERWTGLLRTAAVLTEAEQFAASVGVFEADSSVPASSAEVIVHVLRPEDNNLFYLYGSVPYRRLPRDRAVVQVGDGWIPGAVLARTRMYDSNDPALNGTFSIASGNEEGHFRLDEAEGVLMLAKRTDACRHFVLNLTAARGSERAWASVNVSTSSSSSSSSLSERRCKSDRGNSSEGASHLRHPASSRLGRDLHPLASEHLSLILLAVLVAVVVFVVLGLFFVFGADRMKTGGPSSASL